jgi:hypothetical protein
VSATDRFNMATVAKGATVVQPGLFDDVAHVVTRKRAHDSNRSEYRKPRPNIVVGASASNTL